jgi:hypothetical protein
MHSLPNLPASIAHEVFARLRSTLPEHPTDTPETLAARDDLAMAAVAALHPTDALDANVAVDIVLAEANYADSLRLAGEYRNDISTTLRCRAQAASMLRGMRSLLRDYQRMQAQRDKAIAEMNPAAMERAGYWFRDVSVPAPEPEQPDSADPPPAGDFASMTEAEQYAVLYPNRARRIRAEGGLPARLDYGPPEPHIVDAIVNGSSPILRELDREPAVGATA